MWATLKLMYGVDREITYDLLDCVGGCVIFLFIFVWVSGLPYCVVVGVCVIIFSWLALVGVCCGGVVAYVRRIDVYRSVGNPNLRPVCSFLSRGQVLIELGRVSRGGSGIHKRGARFLGETCWFHSKSQTVTNCDGIVYIIGCGVLAVTLLNWGGWVPSC